MDSEDTITEKTTNMRGFSNLIFQILFVRLRTYHIEYGAEYTKYLSRSGVGKIPRRVNICSKLVFSEI